MLYHLTDHKMRTKLLQMCRKPYIPETVRGVWDRKCVKRTVMTIPYNAKPYSNRSYIKDALKEKGIEVDKDDLTQIVTSVRSAMGQLCRANVSYEMDRD